MVSGRRLGSVKFMCHRRGSPALSVKTQIRKPQELQWHDSEPADEFTRVTEASSACRRVGVSDGASGPETRAAPHKYKGQIRQRGSGSRLAPCFYELPFPAAAARTRTNRAE